MCSDQYRDQPPPDDLDIKEHSHSKLSAVQHVLLNCTVSYISVQVKWNLCKTAQCNTVECNIVLCNIDHFTTAQCNTVECNRGTYQLTGGSEARPD